MYTAHDTRRAFDPYPIHPSSVAVTASASQPHSSQNLVAGYFPASPHSSSQHGIGVTPVPAQTHFASSSLASALDISKVSSSSRSRLQGETRAQGSRGTAIEAIPTAPYLNQGTLNGEKAPHSNSRQNDPSTGRVTTFMPQQGDAAGLHDNVHQLTYRPQDMHGQQNLYMDHANNGFDFSLWEEYSNSIPGPHDTAAAFNTQHAHSGASTSAAVAAQEPFSSMFLDFEEQVPGGEDAAYMSWTGLGPVPQALTFATEGFQDLDGLQPGAWSQAPIPAPAPSYEPLGHGQFGPSNQHQHQQHQQLDYSGAGAAQRTSHAYPHVTQERNGPHRQTAQPPPVGAAAVDHRQEGARPDTQSASVGPSAFASASVSASAGTRSDARRQIAPTAAGAQVSGGPPLANGPAVGAGPSAYGMQDYFSHVNAGVGGAFLQNQSFMQVQHQPQQYGDSGILDNASSVQSQPWRHQAHGVPHPQANFAEAPVGPVSVHMEAQQMEAQQQSRSVPSISSTSRSRAGNVFTQGSVSRSPRQQNTALSNQPIISPSKSGNARASLERRHTVAEAAQGETNGQYPQTINGSSFAPSSPFEAERNRPVQPTNRSPVAPQARAPVTATLGLGDAMWAQAQEYNRSTLAETYRLRHGREPPRSMNITGTTALERSAVGERALRAAVEEDMRSRLNGEVASSEGGLGERVSAGAGISARSTPGQIADVGWPGAGSEPARPGIEFGLTANGRTNGHPPLSSPVSPTSPDEIVTPRDAVFQVQGPLGDTIAYGTDSRALPGSAFPTQPSLLVRKIAPLLRHDGHLHPHVSGLGGTLSEAYDGRSYLPDDAEPDPNNLPRAPPGARIGDHPALAELRPHPLQPRGERWHALLNPQPEGIEALIAQDTDEEAEGDDEEDEEAQTLRQKRRLAKHAVKEDEKGDGWGFVEGGSHGPGRGLGVTIPEDEEESEGRRKKRLKLTTDQKSPPKMACHFCRNRKIACGEGSIDEKTCNQCERRGLRCVFPTESRRGMRVRKPRSGHTVDGVPESVKDAMDDYGDFDAPDDVSFGATSSPYPAPQQVRKRGGGGRGRGRGRGRPRGPGRVGRPPGRGRARKDELAAADDPVVSGGDDGNVDVDFTMGDEELASGSADLTYDVPADDPLASLAAETRLHEQLNGSPPSYGPPETHQFAVSIGLNSGPFTRNPLSRRKTLSE